MPGVTYDRQVQFTMHGPVVVHVVTAPRPGGLYSLQPALSNETIPSTERLSAIERRLSVGATTAGISGDTFAADGRPSGILMRNGVVGVARGTAAEKLQAEAPVGQSVAVRLVLSPSWAGMVGALGGGPVLVRKGRPVFRPAEAFSTDLLALRQPRAAVGQLADGRIVLVAVDGGWPGFSTGLTNYELAQTLARLGAVTAAALGTGVQAGLAVDGKLATRPPARGGEQPIADALLFSYAGVYAPEPTEPVLSPNRDNVAEVESLA